MIRVSLVYAGVTLLLAFVDYVRIRQQMGKVENINHSVSWILGWSTAAILWGLTVIIFPVSWIQVFIIPLDLICVRGALYDPALNIMRGLPIYYESHTTSSWIDNHSLQLTFLDKRILAVFGWALLTFLYYKV